MERSVLKVVHYPRIGLEYVLQENLRKNKPSESEGSQRGAAHGDKHGILQQGHLAGLWYRQYHAEAETMLRASTGTLQKPGEMTVAPTMPHL